jgi:hypothetical protein
MTQIKYKSTVQRLIYIIGSLMHVRLPWVSMEVAGLSLLLFLCQHSGREKRRSVGTHSCSIPKWPRQGGPRLGPGTWYYSFSLRRVRSLGTNSAHQWQRFFRKYILPCFQQYVHQFTTHVPAYSEYIFFFKNWTLFGYNFPKYSKKTWSTYIFL